MRFSSVIWAMKLPSYAWLRLFHAPHSISEAKFHSKRRAQSIADACGCSAEAAEVILKEVEQSETIQQVWAKAAELSWIGTFRASPELYAICRLMKPSLVLETGVGSGYSSAHILQALKINGAGKLISVDLPNADPDWKLGDNMSPGFLVPSELKQRWKLVLGDSRLELGKILEAEGSLDIFLHDSLHTFEAMDFEFKSVWPHLRTGGLLLSDDAMWNTAMLQLARKNRRKVEFLYHRGGSLPVAFLKK